jgi:hypothetical protein
MSAGRTTAWVLALAGLAPFIGCAAMVAAGGPDAGAWLAALAGGSPDPVTLGLSNLPALVAWSALLPLDLASPLRLSLLSAGLALMWLWDRRRPPAWYPALRTVATVGALLSLGLAVVVSA